LKVMGLSLGMPQYLLKLEMVSSVLVCDLVELKEIVNGESLAGGFGLALALRDCRSRRDAA
jgi:hypothetical protein